MTYGWEIATIDIAKPRSQALIKAYKRWEIDEMFLDKKMQTTSDQLSTKFVLCDLDMPDCAKTLITRFYSTSVLFQGKFRGYSVPRKFRMSCLFANETCKASNVWVYPFSTELFNTDGFHNCFQCMQIENYHLSILIFAFELCRNS